MTKPEFDSAGVPIEYWFNLKTGTVEFGKLSAASFRVGPFKTLEEANNALATIASRTKEWNDSESRED